MAMARFSWGRGFKLAGREPPLGTPTLQDLTARSLAAQRRERFQDGATSTITQLATGLWVQIAAVTRRRKSHARRLVSAACVGSRMRFGRWRIPGPERESDGAHAPPDGTPEQHEPECQQATHQRSGEAISQVRTDCASERVSNARSSVMGRRTRRVDVVVGLCAEGNLRYAKSRTEQGGCLDGRESARARSTRHRPTSRYGVDRQLDGERWRTWRPDPASRRPPSNSARRVRARSSGSSWVDLQHQRLLARAVLFFTASDTRIPPGGQPTHRPVGKPARDQTELSARHQTILLLQLR
jgi:hypothetical protein